VNMEVFDSRWKWFSQMYWKTGNNLKKIIKNHFLRS